MSYEQKPNSGSAFRNTRKREGKKDADFTGSAMIDGKSYWFDMWQNPPKGDKKGFFSFSLREKDEQRQQPAQEQRRNLPQRPAPGTHGRRAEPQDPDLDAPEDDIPF